MKPPKKIKEIKPVELCQPYLIHLKNTTDEKLYDVKLFNYDYDKQGKIKYSSPTSGVEYAQILRDLSARTEESRKIIDTIKSISHCDYKKFQNKQIMVPFSVMYNKIDGFKCSIPNRFIIDPYQHQDNISQLSGLKMSYCNSLQLELAYLMPETEMTIYLFPVKSVSEKK